MPWPGQPCVLWARRRAPVRRRVPSRFRFRITFALTVEVIKSVTSPAAAPTTTRALSGPSTGGLTGLWPPPGSTSRPARGTRPPTLISRQRVFSRRATDCSIPVTRRSGTHTLRPTGLTISGSSRGALPGAAASCRTTTRTLTTGRAGAPEQGYGSRCKRWRKRCLLSAVALLARCCPWFLSRVASPRSRPSRPGRRSQQRPFRPPPISTDATVRRSMPTPWS